MRQLFFSTLTAALCATSVMADVPEAISKSVLPGYEGFAAAATRQAEAARRDCNSEALTEAWHTAFDAWLGVAHLRLGPSEENGRALAIAFWPDPKAIGARQIEAMISRADPAFLEPDGMAQVSVAARGLFGLEKLLYDEALAGGDYACGLRRALSADLAAMAADLKAGWSESYADLLLSAGAAGNATFLSTDEARQALFTQLVSGLEFNADQRLGRPLGSFDKPRPERAEALASGRSLRNVTLSLEALRTLARALAQGFGEIPQTEAAFERALTSASALDDPVFAGVSEPGGRLKVEILQQNVRLIHEAVLAEIGGLLGVSAGFNAADGD